MRTVCLGGSSLPRYDWDEIESTDLWPCFRNLALASSFLEQLFQVTHLSHIIDTVLAPRR